MEGGFRPTAEQVFCGEQFSTGQKLKVNAYAGTGKTSTLAHLARSTRRTGVYLAFNKSIATEARQRFPQSVSCSTTHAMAFRVMRHRFEVEKMTGKLSGGFLAAKLNLRKFRVNKNIILFSRSVGFLLDRTVKIWQRSDRDEISANDVQLNGRLATLLPGEKDALRLTVAKAAARVWQKMCDPNFDLPIGHDGYLKLWALSKPTIVGDYVLLDEAQDTNGVVIGLMRHQPSQIVAVGDKHQQIYEWRGALNAMNELPSDLEARLSTSFRFGSEIAEYATRILNLLGETVPLTGNATWPSRITPVSQPDAILCRTNSRLIEEAVAALDAGRRPHVVGGVSEILTYVDAAERLMNGQSVDQPLEFFGFADWRQVQAMAETEEGKELKRWVTLIDKYGPAKLRRYLQGLPAQEEDAELVLSTGHKAKGREWPTVRLCDDFLLGVAIEKTTDAATAAAELRLFYVAVTRGRTQVEVPPQLDLKLRWLETVRNPVLPRGY